MVEQFTVIDYMFIGRYRPQYIAAETIFSNSQRINQPSSNLLISDLCASFICLIDGLCIGRLNKKPVEQM